MTMVYLPLHAKDNFGLVVGVLNFEVKTHGPTFDGRTLPGRCLLMVSLLKTLFWSLLRRARWGEDMAMFP